MLNYNPLPYERGIVAGFYVNSDLEVALYVQDCRVLEGGQDATPQIAIAANGLATSWAKPESQFKKLQVVANDELALLRLKRLWQLAVSPFGALSFEFKVVSDTLAEEYRGYDGNTFNQPPPELFETWVTWDSVVIELPNNDFARTNVVSDHTGLRMGQTYELIVRKAADTSLPASPCSLGNAENVSLQLNIGEYNAPDKWEFISGSITVGAAGENSAQVLQIQGYIDWQVAGLSPISSLITINGGIAGIGTKPLFDDDSPSTFDGSSPAQEGFAQITGLWWFSNGGSACERTLTVPVTLQY